jgi:hypothetical protein
MMEVELGKIAEDHASNPRVKSFGAMVEKIIQKQTQH